MGNYNLNDIMLTNNGSPGMTRVIISEARKNMRNHPNNLTCKLQGKSSFPFLCQRMRDYFSDQPSPPLSFIT